MRRIEKAFTRLLFGVLRVFIHVRKVVAVPRDSVHNILVIRQHNQLGDMLCAVPLLRSLRATYPRARIALLARPLNSEILRGASFLDEVIVYDKKTFLRSPFAVWLFARALKKRRFDLAIVPSTVSMSVTSDVIAFLSGAKRRIGPASLNGKRNVTGFLHNIRVDLDWRRDPSVHQTQRNIDIASILVLDPVSHELEIALTDEEVKKGRAFLDKRTGGHELIVGFHPGAAKVPNRWDALRFAEIANRCAEILGAFIVVTAGPDDDDPVHEMTVHMPNDHVVLRNEPIRFTASVIRHCSVFVTNDTGIMHVSAAVGTPTLSLFGPTDPLQWAPHGRRHRFILGRGGSVDSITVEKVWDVLTDMLRAFAASAPPRERQAVEYPRHS
ncbi:MAG: glycosyltransferase family 9 protein [Bacteroidota bacterium]|nr:glycosyltransferase family 9 protein [Bacteroidota bacterium]